MAVAQYKTFWSLKKFYPTRAKMFEVVHITQLLPNYVALLKLQVGRVSSNKQVALGTFLDAVGD